MMTSTRPARLRKEGRAAPPLPQARPTALRLLAYCRANHWVGYDPYDALNSRIFKSLPFLNAKGPRLALTQGVKRCPVNLRPLLGIPKSPSAKGIALFLQALIRLSKIGLVRDEDLIGTMANRLLALRSPGSPLSCWGYPFDWQTRGELVPKDSPNIICSTFAAHALLDAYEHTREPAWLLPAVETAEFLLRFLLNRDAGRPACFAYTPSRRSEIHNANLLGAAFLCRIGRISARTGYLDPALEAAWTSVRKQHEDGSWPYGESPGQQWVDNFHTGFNLTALRRIGESAETKAFEFSLARGFDYYTSRFFREDGAPKYYHDATYPIDIHSVAQSMITLLEVRDLSEESVPLALSVFRWAMAHMWDARGFFYFQKRRAGTVRTPFMRWSQAWMLLALASMAEALPVDADAPSGSGGARGEPGS